MEKPSLEGIFPQQTESYSTVLVIIVCFGERIVHRAHAYAHASDQLN
jgi:hypothetical protein